MQDLEGAEIKLQIDDFGKDNAFSDIISNYHGLCVDYYSIKLGILGYIHTKDEMRRVM